jgi:hypothetical protein
MGFVFAFAVVPLVLAGFIGIGAWILSPLDRAARQMKAPVRFSISDFLCLFLAVQVPLTVVYLLIESDEPGTYWTFTFASWVVGPLTWYVCAQALSRAGVSRGLHRVLFLGGVLPVVYYGLILIVVLPFLALGARMRGDTAMLIAMPPWVALWFVVALLLGASAYYTRWLARQSFRVGVDESIELVPVMDAESEPSPYARVLRGQNGATTAPDGSSDFSGHSSHLGRLRRQ